MYLTPVSPWNAGFDDASRKGTDVFIRIDPEFLIRTTPAGSVMQTASGTVIVRGAVVPRAIISVTVMRAGGYFHLWHRDLADQSPTSAGPKALRSRATWQQEGMNWRRKDPVFATSSGDSVPARPARRPAPENPADDALWMLTSCMTCQEDMVSGTVECFACGATQFYNATRCENLDYAKALREADELAKVAAAVETNEAEQAEIRKLVNQRKEMRVQQYGSSGGASIEKRLRDKVVQLHRHRWRWLGTSAEADQFRRKHAEAGGTIMSWVTGRTESWAPKDGKDCPLNQVQVTPAEVTYYFLSVIMDVDGKPTEGQALKPSVAKSVSDTLAQIFVDIDFEEISTRVMDDVDATNNWLWNAYQAKRQAVRGDYRATPVADIWQHWPMVREALLVTQTDLSLCKAVILRDTGKQNNIWRKGEDSSKGQGRSGGSASTYSYGRAASWWYSSTKEGFGPYADTPRPAHAGALVGRHNRARCTPGQLIFF